MRGPPVVLTNTLGRPVTNVISERGAVPMTVVNTLGEPVTLVASGGEPVTLFNANGTLWDYPFSLFANNEQGAWYDPSDFSTLFQDSTGTTPVTAVEQPVRLMLDRSKGLVLGGELVNLASLPTPTITNNAGTVGVWDAATRTMSNTGSAVSDHPRFTFALGLVVGRTYFVTGVLSGSLTQINSPAGIRLAASGSANTVPYNSATGVFSGYVVAAATNLQIVTELDGAESLTISSLSVRELPGNHALAPNDASRPVLRARYNLLTFSEQFDNAGWAKTGTTITANAAVAPDGTMTADKMVEVAAASTPRVGFGAAATIISAVYTLSVYAQAAERDQIRIVLEGSGSLGPYFLLTGAGSVSGAGSTTSSITNVGNGWYRCVVTYTAGATNPSLYIATASGGAVITSGDNTKGVLLWGAQLLTAADQTSTGGAYQRIAAATDYDVSNPVWRPYLAFDGSDDSLSTSSIDFSGTDEMTVFAGVTKLSDAAFNGGIIVELTASSAANDGAFDLLAPDNVSPRYYVWRSKGTTRRGDFASSAVYAAPVTNVLTGIGDISGDLATLRINGTQIVTDIGDQGSGNYANAALFIGRRNNASLPFNGRLTSLIVLGRTATAAEISATESWVAGKTGVTL